MSDDVQAITAMVHRYCELFDTGDFDAFARQFEHGRWFRADPGYEATRAWIDANVHTYDGLPGTKHVTTNLVVDVDGDEATASSYITVLQAVPGLPLQPIFSGRYRDRFERSDGKWRWVERGVLGDLYGDTSHHTRTARTSPATPSVRELADRQEIADLCVRYARALDRHDWEALAACFVPDAVYLYPGGRTDGVDAVIERCRAALTPLDGSQHLIGSILTEVDGDEGRASSYFHAQHVRAGTEGGDTFVIAGSYDDRVVRTPEGWRIARARPGLLLDLRQPGRRAALTPVVDGREEDARLADLAGQRAEGLLRTAEAGTTPAERRRSRRLGRILADPAARELVVSLTDEVLRSPDRRRAMRRYRALIEGKLPRGFGLVDRVGLRLASVGTAAAPRAVGRVVTARVLRETRGVILPAEDPAFARHVARRRAEGMDVNVNLLGEAILGDDEAAARFRDIGLRLARTDVDCVSVKISALCANLDVLAFGHSVERIVARLRPLLRLAASSTPPKLVNLDMEEHRDLELTLAAFRQVLEEPELVHVPAGVALQAYLPDSHAALDELIAWARRRRAAGGAWTRVRLVKGANLGMEQVEAELAGWPPAPYASKPDVDASFKRMLDAALDAAATGDLRVGVASHNLFDVAWALTLRDERGLQESVEVEMLEGMAPAQARAARDDAGGLLLYTPVVAASDVAASIAYLSRRLDENAAEGNFLRSLFSITPGSRAWRREREAFENAVTHRHDVSTTPRQTQDRVVERREPGPDEPFANEPDTDFTVAANRAWVESHLGSTPSAARPPLLKDAAAIDAVVGRARRAAAAWARTSTEERRKVLTGATAVMAAARGRTLAVMAQETAKTIREGDPEVSEGVDMARWAATSTHTLDELAADGVACAPLGVVLVTGPWNFPYAIPANGVVGAVAAGNAVILKPAPEAVATAAELVRQLHEAGIPDDVVQLVRCPDDDVGRHLVTHEGVDAVVLTGSYDTARLFLDWRPSLRLLAETSGKNAMVITGAADVDLAIKDLVRSAFGHAGQKCSAASLAIVEGGIHDDPHFQARLADAVRSLRVGPATDLATMVGPVIHPPEGPLRRALTRIDEGERWLVEPRLIGGDGRLWTPGVRIGLQAGSWFHLTECFGPVLGILRADDLDHAIELQNGTDFGLTGGLQSLDPAEIGHWLERVEVGNAYVNRHMTGAIVRRQPFGGWKRSSVGRGAKAGGPDDILRFLRPVVAGPPLDATASYLRWWREQFGTERDDAGLACEANVLRYRSVRGVVVRATAATTTGELSLLRRAAALTGVTVSVSAPPETDAELAARLAASGAERLRTLGPIDDDLAAACHQAGVAIDDTPVTGHGRIELPCWLREQSVSQTMHRHGRLQPRQV